LKLLTAFCGAAAFFAGVMTTICRCHPPFPQRYAPVATGHEPVSSIDLAQSDGAVTLAHCFSSGVEQIGPVAGS
jgi:hypothetical protein